MKKRGAYTEELSVFKVLKKQSFGKGKSHGGEKMSRYIADHLVEEIIRANDIVDVVSTYVKLEKKGKYMFGLCPFHREKTASFSVTGPKQMYYCYSCGRGGNVVNFIKDIENLDFIDAIEFLANRVNITIPDTVNIGDIKLSNLKKELSNLNKVAAKFYYGVLHSDEGTEAKEYLDKRGLSEGTLRKFGLGYSSNEWDDLYQSVKNEFSGEALEKSGLFLKNKNGSVYDRFRGRVMFPIFNVMGDVIAFGGRIIADGEPKYLNSPETVIYSKRKNLYALNFAKKYSKESLIIVEGYMDAVSLHQAGVKNAVASLGTAFTEDQARLVKKYTEEVVIAYDMDMAGRKATERAIKVLEGAGIRVKILSIPQGKDPDEFIKNYGKDVFNNLVDDASIAFEYRVNKLREEVDIASVDGKIKFLNSVAEILSGVYNNLERDVYINKIAKDYDVSQESILKELKRISKKGDKDNSGLIVNNNRIGIAKKENDVAHYEKLILIMLANNNSLYWKMEKYLKEITVHDEKIDYMLFEVIERIKNKEGVALNEILGALDDVDAGELVRMSEEECNFENNEKAILDIINKIRIASLMERQRDIIQKLSSEDRKKDEEVLKHDLMEVMASLKKLKN
ncbi:MAG: DNA primase [Clostridiales bacterium]|nr:DNA primase [Clostridiales bacterium]